MNPFTSWSLKPPIPALPKVRLEGPYVIFLIPGRAKRLPKIRHPVGSEKYPRRRAKTSPPGKGGAIAESNGRHESSERREHMNRSRLLVRAVALTIAMSTLPFLAGGAGASSSTPGDFLVTVFIGQPVTTQG